MSCRQVKQLKMKLKSLKDNLQNTLDTINLSSYPVEQNSNNLSK